MSARADITELGALHLAALPPGFVSETRKPSADMWGSRSRNPDPSEDK